MLKGIIFSLVLVASFTFISCGGGSSSVVDTVDTVEDTALEFPLPDVGLFSEENIALAQSLEVTHAALLQSILVTNTYIFVDPTKTDFATFEERRQKALDATRILIEKIDIALEKEAAEAARMGKISQKVFPVGAYDIAPPSIISPTPLSDSRPVKDSLDSLRIGAVATWDTLSDPESQLSEEDYNDPVKLNVWKERINFLKDIAVLVGVGVTGAATISLLSAPAAVYSAAAATYILFTGQTLKMAMSGVTWSAAENNTNPQGMPEIFKGVLAAHEYFTIFQLTNGPAVVGYITDKLYDFTYSEGVSIDFAGDKIFLSEVASALLTNSQADTNLSESPSITPGQFITPDGVPFTVDISPSSYRMSIATLPSESVVPLFDGPDSCPQTYDPLFDPDNDYAYNIYINDKDNNGIFEDRIECSYYPSGSIYTEFPYIDNKLNGDKKRYYETGILEVYTHYIDDVENGITRWYYESGNLKEETLWKDGVVNGLKTVYYDSDQVHYTMMFIDGKAEGEAREYYETGELHFILPFVNNLYHGVLKDFYINGQLHWETTYVNGKKEGPSTGYFETGEIQFIMNFVNDTLDGKYWELDIHENVIACYLYEDGVIVDNDFCHDQFTI